MGRIDAIREAITGGGPVGGPAGEHRSLKEELRAAVVMGEVYQENLARLEDNMDAGEWRRTAFEIEREFTRPGLDDIVDLSRAYYLSHPLIKRVVNVTTYYTFAQGVTYKAMEDRVAKEVVEPQIEDEGNRREFYSHQATLLTDVDQIVEGNVFMGMFTSLQGDVQLRSFPTKQIREIYHKKGDARTITFYRRVWAESYFDEQTGTVKQEQHDELYPDYLYHPKQRPEMIGRAKVNWDCPIIHKRSGGMKDMQFGIPETYAALDWARAYRKFLENWHTLVASLAKFAWNMQTKGSKVKAAKEKLRSHLDESDTWDEEEDIKGEVFIGKPGDKMEAIPKTGAHTSAEDARPSRLMVAAASDLPDTIVSGDVDVGNFATSKTLDRPTWLRMRSRQFAERDFRQAIFRYSVDAKVRAGVLPGKVIWDVDGGNSVVQVDFDPTVKVSFPPILQEDTLDMVKAIIAAATLEGKTEVGTIPPELLSKMLMESLEVEDVESALEEISPEERADLQKAVEDLEKMASKVGKEPEPKKEPEGAPA